MNILNLDRILLIPWPPILISARTAVSEPLKIFHMIGLRASILPVSKILPLPPMWFPIATSPTSGSTSGSDYAVMSKTSCYISKIVNIFLSSDDYYVAAPLFYLSDPCYHRGFLAPLMSSWLASQKVFNWDNHQVWNSATLQVIVNSKI